MLSGRATPLAAEKHRISISPTSLGAAAADGVIIVAWGAGKIDTPSALGAHVLLACMIFGATALLRRGLRALHVLRFLVLLVLGPLGGCVLLILDLGRILRARVSQPGRDVNGSGTEAHKRSGQAWAIYAAIRQGRRTVMPQSKSSRFIDIFESGDLALQNAAIAAISRRYRPEMLPALMAALNSPVPAVRVQAAAVYAKLRNHYGERAKALLVATEGDRDQNANVTLAAECANVARSGFVDTALAFTLESRAEALARLEVCRPGAGQDVEGNELANMSDTSYAPLRKPKRFACGAVS